MKLKKLFYPFQPTNRILSAIITWEIVLDNSGNNGSFVLIGLMDWCLVDMGWSLEIVGGISGI